MKKSEPKAKSSTEAFDLTLSKKNKSTSKELSPPVKEQLMIENERLRSRLEEVEETLNAIHRGEVDAIVVSGPEDDQIYSLSPSEATFRIFIEEMSEGAATLSENGNILFCNHKLAELVNEPIENLINSSFKRFIAPEDQSKFDSLQYEEIYKGEVEVKISENNPDNEPIYLKLSVSPFPFYLVSNIFILIATDISWLKKKENELYKTEKLLQHQLEELNTSRLTTMKLLKETEEAKNILEITNQQLAKEIVGHKLAQKKLSESEAKFKKLYEDGPLGMAMVNIDLHFVMANNNFCQMMGYNEQEIKRLTFKDITHPDNISIDFENLKKLVRGEIPVYKTEKRYIRKDKTIIWGFLTVSVFRANDGKTRYFIAMVKDITDRKRVEETLQSSYLLLRIAGKTAKFGGWSFNIAENKFIWSDEVASIHEMPSGYSPLFNEAINFYAQEWRNKFITFFNDCKQNGMPCDEVLPLNTAKGNHLWVRLTGEALRDENGKIIKVQGSIQDITELKWNEAVNASKMHLIQFSQEHSLDELLEELLNEAEKLTGSFISFIDFVEEDQDTIRLQKCSSRTKAEFCKFEGNELPYFISDAGVWTDCVYQRKPVIHNDYTLLPHRKGLAEGHAELIRELGVPIFRGEKLAAILSIGNKPGDYNQQDVQTVSLLANFAWEIAERMKAEEALRDSQLKYRIVADNTYAWEFWRAWDGSYLYQSPSCKRVTGYEADEFINDTEFIIRIIHPEDRDVFKQYHRSMLIDPRPARIEFRIITADEALKWINLICEPVFDPGGEFLGIRGSYRDITDTRRAEETLRRMNRQLQAISNCNQTLLRAADEQTLLNEICRIVCDEAGYRFAWVGYREHDDTKSIRSVTWAGVEEGYLKSTNITWSGTKFGGDPTGTAIRSGEITFIQDLSTYPREETWCTNALHRGYQSCIALPLKDESTNTFGALTIYSGEQNAFTPEEIHLLKELAGNLAFGITALRIRTENKRVGESLWESSQMLNLVLNTMPSFVFWKDCNSVYQGCNYLFAANAGLSSPEVIVGLTDLDLPWKDSEAASYRTDDRMVIETGIPKINYEETQLTNDGRITCVRTSKIPLRNHEGDIIGVLGTFEDISARRFAEEEIKKLNQTLEERVARRTAQLEAINNELESFSYSISHDLRAPLRAISGFSQILSTRHRKTLNDQGRQYMDYIVEASLRMEQLINDLLDYSRLGRKSLDIRPVKLSKIINNVHSDFKKKLEEIGAKFIIDKELPEVPGDESLFRQIFSNLIDNAITYRRKEVQLEIKIEYEPKEKGYMLKITDNGIGIPKEHWEKIFNVFQRLHSEDVYPGTGIGLATVRKALNILQGTVGVESVVGEGSSFIIYLIK